jgi:hypothetical protein
MNILKETIETVRHNIRIMVFDTDMLKALDVLLDRLLAVSQFSPNEALEVARLVCNDILAYGKAADCSGEAREMVVDFGADFTVWYNVAKEADRKIRATWRYLSGDAECYGRWESRGKAHWVELWGGPGCWYHKSKGCAGDVCRPGVSVDGALTVILSMIARNRFLPDNAKLPMKRVK